jgi:glucuronosyltransferase
LFYRSNKTKYDLVFLEGVAYQSYHGLIHHVGSPPVIGIVSYGTVLTAGEEIGNPTNPAFIPELLLPYETHMTFYERLQNTLFWLWMRCVNFVDIANTYCLVTISLTEPSS